VVLYEPGSGGTGKKHIALALGLAACQKGYRVRFSTAAAMVHDLIEAKDEMRLLRYQKQIAAYELLTVDELDFVPLSKTGVELLFEVFSQRYERGSTLVTSNLPFQEWTEILGSERLTGALLDHLTIASQSITNALLSEPPLSRDCQLGSCATGPKISTPHLRLLTTGTSASVYSLATK